VTLAGVILPGERRAIERRLASTRGVRNWTLDLREVADIDAAAGSQTQTQQRIG
jgi:hypothetical protein